MILDVTNLGEILISHPAGKEAFAMAKAYIFNKLTPAENLTLDFKNVKVLAPYWADEFITNIKSVYPNKIECINTQNESVSQSLKFVEI